MGTFSSISKAVSGEKPFGKTPYQANTANPATNKKQEEDRTSTAYALSNIYDVYQTNPERGTQLANEFHGYQLDRSTPVYNPFIEPTNPAVAQMQELGFDVSNLDDAWFEKNSWLKQYYVTTDNTNNLSSTMTNKKASNEQRAAYAFNQLDKQRETTAKAKSESAALTEELGYMANDPNHNYSDDYIISHIDWKKYPTLAKMKETAAQGTPMELNSPVEMATDDWMHGVLWAARNDGGTGYSNLNMVRWYQGEGKQWTDDPEISAKLTWKGEDYSPFSVGMTAGEEGRYFGVYSFGEQEIQRLQDGLDPKTGEPLDPNDATAMKMRDNVLSANETTNQAKRELGVFQKKLDEKLKDVTDPEEAQKIVDDLLDSEVYDKETKESITFDTLKKMDASLNGSPDSLVKTTDAVDYRKQDMVKYALDRINANAGKETGTDVQDGISSLQGEGTGSTSGGATVGNAPKATETEAAIAEAQDSELKEVKAAMYDGAGEMEQAVMDNGWSVTYDGVKNAWDNIVNYGRTFVDNLATKVKDSVLSDHTESTLSTLQSMFDYDMRTENIQRMELRRDELQKKYGSALLIGQEPESEVSKTITVDGEKYQIFLSNIYTEDGSYTLDAADQFYNGDPFGVGDKETWNKILGSDEYRKAVEEENAKAKAIADANESLNKPYFTDEYRAEVQAAAEELRSLDLQIEDAKLANAQDEQQYQKDQKAFDAAQKKLDQQIYVMGMLGMDTSDLVEYQDTIAYLTNFSNYEATVWSAYNPNDMYRYALAEGEDRDAIFEAAKRGNDQIASELETARARKKYIEDHGLNVPQNYLDNLDRHIAKLERDVQDYEDFILSKNEDWDEMVAKGKQEEYDTRPQQWSLIHNPELDYNQEEYYAHMDEDVSEEYSAFANHGLRGISGIFTGQMTQQEKDTYYYLMGKGEKERAREYVESLIDMSYGVLHTRLTNEVREKTEGMLREEKSQDFATKEEADKWIEQNGEKFKDYQLTEDENGYHISWSQSTGAGAFIGTNLLAVLAAPGAAMASLGYMGYSLFTGNELNPDNVFLAANTFRSTTREQSAKEIADYYGEGTVMQKAVQMFYEMVSNRLDSAMMGFTVGGLSSGVGNEMLREFLGASPMGFSAAMDAMMEAKRKGASDAQAWGIGFVTFIAETGTEAISLDNMKKAFKLGEEVTGEGIKAFLKQWLTQGGISEMLGESANDVIENLADELIMGELSDHKDRVWAYRMQNYSKEDAEAMARRDEIAGVLRTAFMSYLSPGMDIVSYGIGRADYYRQKAKQYQQAGINTSTLQVAKAEREARIEEQRAADAAVNDELGSFDLEAVDEELARREARDREAEIAENGVENGEGRFTFVGGEPAFQQEDADIDVSQLQSKTNPEQAATPAESAKVDIGTQYNALESVKNADTSSQSATISSVLDTAKTEESADMANAATMKLGEMLGEGVNAAEFVQDMLLGADAEGVEAAPLMQAIQNASLGGESSAAWQLMQTEEFKNADYGEQAAMLAGTVEIDSANQAVAQQIGNSVHDYLVVQAEKEILKNGTLDSVKQAQEKVAQAARNLQMAQESLEEKQGELQAKGEALQAATEEFNQNPTADNQHSLDRALNEYNRADIVEREYQQHLDNVQRANEEAKANAKSVQETAFRDLRQQAEAMVADQMQQRQERLAQEAEQQRIADEQAAQAQAEEDERTGKAEEDRQNSIIESIADNEHLEGEERKDRIDELKEQANKVKIRIKDLNKPVNNTEGALAIHAFSRKLGIPIEFGDLGAVNGNKIVRGKYVYDKETGTAKIVLNQNLIKSGKMSVGQALVEASLHEIVHSMRNTGSYNTFRKVVMQSVFNASNDVDAMTMYNENADFRAKVDYLIAERKAAGDSNFIGKSLEEQVNAAEDEIVADFARLNLAEKDVVQRFMDSGLGGRMRNALHNVNQLLKNYFGNLTGEERKTAEYLRRAERAFQKAMVESAKSDIHPNSESFSVSQIAESMNLDMVVNDDTLQLYMPSENGDIVGNGENGLEKNKRYVLIDGVTEGKKITPDMIVNTPVGMLIDMGLDNKEFTDEQGNVRTQQGDARQMFADLMNLCARYKDNNLIWEIAGSEFSEAFSALKSNSDPQYKNTVDFGTICSKTQGIVDVLSQTMIDRVNKIRQWNAEHAAEIEAGTVEEKVFTGLKREDIMEVYNLTHNAGLSVPCPVCYVFSRWMGVPGMLGQMNRFQHEYVALAKDNNKNVLYDENGDAVVDWDKTFEKANGYLLGMVKEYTKTSDNPDGINLNDPNLTPEQRKAAIKLAKDKIADKKNSINSKIRTRQKSLPKLNDQLGVLEEKLDNPKLTDKQREKIEGQIERKKAAIKKNINETDQFMEDIKEFEAFNWVSQVVCVQHTEGRSAVNDLDENGNFVMDKENFRYTPEEILFDLNRSGEFAGYAKNWRYRTTRGAGMGKAIMPYSGASIGDIIHGDALRWKQSENPLLQMDRAAAEKAWESAKKRVKQQNLVGGQRFQSTSDFRPEWGLDYIMSFLEMQALGSKVQMYTKVAEAVDFLGSIGADVNLSIMAKNNGFHEATPEEIALSEQDTDEGREMKSRMGTLDGKTYVMEFSDVTGMDYDTAKGKTKKFNNVQMILVGMNDIHIKLALGNEDIDFVIPWHSSGNSKDVLQQLVSSVGEELLESSDYTDTQTDQIKSHKVGKGKNEKTIDDRTESEIKLWDARVKLLTEGGKALTEEERNTLLKNDITKELYRRFTEEGYDPDCFGVTLTKDQAEQVFPYEYWDKSSTRENADVNGERFVAYCDALGLVPRFSQFKDVPGYWKLLIDRKMYDNNVLDEKGNVVEYGKYRDQKVVDVTKARMDNDPNQALDEKTSRKKKVYQLPEETTARYGRKNYSEQTEAAIEASGKYLSEKYDVKEQRSELGDLTEADRDLMESAKEDYQSAVSRGDTEAAQEAMDFYAEQKGYTEKAYHGTPRFGFTQFDTERSNGAVFVSFDKELAGTYTHGDQRRIREDINRVEYDSANAEQLINIVRDKDERIKYKTEKGWHRITEINQNDDGNFQIKTSNGNSFIISGDELAETINENREIQQFGLGGVYQLYAKPGNQLVIDADGNEHNNIPVDWSDEMQTTNTIAEYAKEHGYDSVRINNVYDPGGYAENDSDNYGDVGIFFNQSDVKSADPVTYDNNGNQIPLDQRFTDSPDIRYSTEGDLTEADQDLMRADNDYSDAISRGDMETAQRMVDNAAVSAGYTTKAYHGSPQENITQFDINNLGANTGSRDVPGFFFTNRRGAAEAYLHETNEVKPEYRERYKKALETYDKYHDSFDRLNGWYPIGNSYGEYVQKTRPEKFKGFYDPESAEYKEYDQAVKFLRSIDDDELLTNPKYTERKRTGKVYDTYLNMENPYVYDAEGSSWVPDFWSKVMTSARSEGGLSYNGGSFDGIIVKNFYDFDVGEMADVYVVFDPNQIKSADPVTYDENGNVIPLSERFNQQSQDIRYSSEGDLTDADRDLMRGAAAGMVNGMVGYTASNDQIKFDNAPSDQVRENLKIIGMNYDEERQIWYDSGRRDINQETIVKAVEDGNNGIKSTPPPRLVPKRQPNKKTPEQKALEDLRKRVKEGELNQTLVNAGIITPEELAAYQEKEASLPLEGQNPTMSTGQGTKIRAFAAEDGMLQDADQLDRFAKAVVTAQNTYFPDTNEDQVIRAVKWIRSLKQTENSDGYAEALQNVTSGDFDYRSADGQARMVAVMAIANARNDIIGQTALADAFMRQGTDLGRALQARKLFKLMTPEGRISTLMKTLNDYNADLKQKGMNGNLKFSDWILQAAAFAETQEDFRKVQMAAAAELAEKLPSSWKERLNSLRMLSMLGNPRTHIRNLVGNMLFVPSVGLKNKIGAILELGVKKGERTKTLSPFLNSEIREFARQDARTIRDTLTGEAKYDEHGLVEKAKNPLGPVLGKLSDVNSRFLEGEDWLFLRGHYRRALGGWMQANGYTVEQVKSDKKLLEKGREYAINEAQKATYRDFNGLAQKLNQIARNAETPGQKALAFGVNAVLPFRKTPANILKRGIEYSPLGIARSVYNLGKMFKNGDVTATSVIDQFASGLSGTAVMAIGFLLAGTGALSCGFDDDDWPEELKGKQKYSINPGKAGNAIANLFGIPKLFGEDVTYTLDWAAPMSMPLFVGASIRNQADTDGWDYNKVLDALGSISEPVFNLSMLDGVNSLIKVNSYSDENPFTQIGAKVVSNYVSSYVPSALGAITRTFFDDTQRKSFVTKGQNTGIEGTFRYAWETAENKIPGVSKTNIPVRDVWGREKTSDFAERLIENFISPGYIEHYEDDPVINELGRLFDSTRSPALEPEHAATSVKIDKKPYNLGPKEFDTFDRVHGETQYSMLNELVNSQAYQELTDDDAKVEIISNIYSYANDVAKNALFPNYRYEKQTVADFIRTGKVKSYKSKMITCLEDGNYEGFSNYVGALREENVSDTDISRKIGDSYSDRWKDAYARATYLTDAGTPENEAARKDLMRIEDLLDNTGFSFNIFGKNGWEQKVDEQYSN